MRKKRVTAIFLMLFLIFESAFPAYAYINVDRNGMIHAKEWKDPKMYSDGHYTVKYNTGLETFNNIGERDTPQYAGMAVSLGARTKSHVKQDLDLIRDAFGSKGRIKHSSAFKSHAPAELLQLIKAGTKYNIFKDKTKTVYSISLSDTKYFDPYTGKAVKQTAASKYAIKTSGTLKYTKYISGAEKAYISRTIHATYKNRYFTRTYTKEISMSKYGVWSITTRHYLKSKRFKNYYVEDYAAGSDYGKTVKSGKLSVVNGSSRSTRNTYYE